MTRPDTYKQIADYFTGLGTLFEVLAAESASAPVSAAGPVAATPAAAPASFDSADYDTPWEEMASAPPDGIPRNSKEDQVLGECPVHFQPWTVREGGVSNKTGKPYAAFWKCNGKNADGSYCNKKPTPGWVKTHNPEKALAAA